MSGLAGRAAAPPSVDASLPSSTPESPWRERLEYWGRLPGCWLAQAARNGADIVRVIDLLKLRPIGPGCVPLEHPWVTGIDPGSGAPVWPQNVVYRTPAAVEDALADDEILWAVGKFLAGRVRQSATLPEIPPGPKRRMPHAINYMHGASHYNSGIILLNDFTEGFRHLSDWRFRRELRRFVRGEQREVLFVFRQRRYDPQQYAYLSCCMRSYFRWFCNPNGPEARVLWGNHSPYPAANLITGHWSTDVYALKRPDGAQRVVRPPIEPGRYFDAGPYHGLRDRAAWPERLLAWGNHLRVRVRGPRGGMFFVDRRQTYRDQIARRQQRGLPADDRATFLRE